MLSLLLLTLLPLLLLPLQQSLPPPPLLLPLLTLLRSRNAGRDQFHFATTCRQMGALWQGAGRQWRSNVVREGGRGVGTRHAAKRVKATRNQFSTIKESIYLTELANWWLTAGAPTRLGSAGFGWLRFGCNPVAASAASPAWLQLKWGNSSSSSSRCEAGIIMRACVVVATSTPPYSWVHSLKALLYIQARLVHTD